MDELVAPSSASTSIIPAKIQWPEAPSIKQSFSLPSSIIYYIGKNPSTPAVYDKLTQSCKYFLEINPILIVDNLYGDTVCSSESCGGGQDCCIKFDINKVITKIWLAGDLELGDDVNPDFTSILCPKLFRCNLRCFALEEKVALFDDFKDLCATAYIVDLNYSKIINKDGSAVLFEKIVESLSDTVKHFSVIFDENDFSMITAKSMNTIIQLKSFQQLEGFHMYNLPEIVKIENLLTAITNYKHISLQFDFAPNLSEGYMQQLDGLVDFVIESQALNCVIKYDGQDKEKYKIMKSRFVDADIFDSDDEDADE